MKRTTHLLRDATGEVRAVVRGPEGQDPQVEPWMLHGIRSAGWKMESWDTHEVGVEVHGFADWMAVADNLAACLRMLLSDDVAPTPAEMDVLFEQAQGALDDYDVAHMEVVMAGPDGEEPDEEDDDGSARD